MIMNKAEIFSRLHLLPPMPQVIHEVMASFRDDKLDSDVLASMIARDQALSAKVLRVANSSFYGLSRQVASIQDATAVLGFDCVWSLVLYTVSAKIFPSAQGGLFDRNQYWKRSFRVASYAKAVAQGLHLEPKMAYTAGMFHDVGQLLLDACIPDQFAKILRQQNSSGLSLIEIEQSQWDFDHVLIGTEIARLWNFPVKVEDAIHYWRTPEHEPFEPFAGVIHAATLLESGLFADSFIEKLPGVLRDKLHVNWKSLEAYLPDSAQLQAEANSMVGS